MGNKAVNTHPPQKKVFLVGGRREFFFVFGNGIRDIEDALWWDKELTLKWKCFLVSIQGSRGLLMIRRQRSGYLGICEGNRRTLDVAIALKCMWPWW